MMKLKHLFNNINLTEMLLGNWVYDADSLNLLQNFRISANAVYPFKANNQWCFLRFAPVEEKSRERVLAELEYLRYLRSFGYPAVDTVLSKEGQELEEASTPWGEYLAVVFRGVSGKALDRLELNEKVIFNYGKALGRMHKLAVDFRPGNYRRPDYNDQFKWMEEILQGFPGETGAMSEI
ncbi:MAG TPA: phosphotransferase, partial [Bacillota bacterium]|nr:phosphotransferase [Bacillota bacterium]